MAKNKLGLALDKASEFINSLENANNNDSKNHCELFFSLADEGTVMLDGEDAINYRKCLHEFALAVGSDSISPKAIENLFTKAIFFSLDIQEKRRDVPFEKRKIVAIKELQKSLTAKPINYEIYYPVDGIALEGLPIHIGNVEFCKFDDVHLSRFLKILLSDLSDEKISQRNASIAETIKSAEIVNKPVGLVNVDAIDSEAAKTKALKDLSVAVDIVNFFSDLIPFQKGHIFLPGENENRTINVLSITTEEKPDYSFGWKSVGLLMPVSFVRLIEEDEKRKLGFSRIQNLLARETSNLEEKLISAIQWCGKASVEGRKGESFLLYAISLESLVLLDNERDELTYRLSTRVAHLLGKDLESRIKISKNVGDIYRIRSKIVHNGFYQVTDADLNLIRLYSKSCILRILNDELFTSMNSVDNLVQWFNDQVLQ